MEWKLMWKHQDDENLKATIRSTDYGSSKTTEGCEIFQLLGQHVNK
jgi:hypothetical protein